MSGPVDAYLDALAMALTAGAHRRRRILAEARAHLTDTADRQQLDGLGRVEAEAAAVEAFGPVATIADAFEPDPTVLRVASVAGLHLGLLAALALVTVGVSGALAGVMGLLAGPDFVSGAAPAGLDAAACARLAASEPGAASCAEAWSWHHLEETVLYRGLPGVLGLVLLVIQVVVARRYLPRTSWALRITQGAAIAGIATLAVLVLASGYAWSILETDATPLGSSRVGDGWWASIQLACGISFSVVVMGYLVARRRPLLNG